MVKEVTEEDLIKFLSECAPEQVQFITGPYFDHGENIAFGWYIQERLVGCIRYCIQEIGMEQKTPPIMQHGAHLKEAKINAFAVDPGHRNISIGKQLQKKVITDARQKGCYQIASYSTYDKVENYAVKIGLGFCVQPEMQADGTMGCYFLMKL